jgi:transposase
MNKNVRKNHTDAFKFKVALEAVKETRTVAEICSEYSIAAAQVYAWKKQLEEQGKEIFADKRKKTKNYDEDVTQLRAKIGQLTMECDFLSHVLGR